MNTNVGVICLSDVGLTVDADVGTFRSFNVGPLIKCMLAANVGPTIENQ